MISPYSSVLNPGLCHFAGTLTSSEQQHGMTLRHNQPGALSRPGWVGLHVGVDPWGVPAGQQKQHNAQSCVQRSPRAKLSEVQYMQGGAIGMSPQGVGGNAPQIQVVDSLFMANTAVNGAGVFVQRWVLSRPVLPTCLT